MESQREQARRRWSVAAIQRYQSTKEHRRSCYSTKEKLLQSDKSRGNVLKDGDTEIILKADTFVDMMEMNNNIPLPAQSPASESQAGGPPLSSSGLNLLTLDDVQQTRSVESNDELDFVSQQRAETFHNSLGELYGTSDNVSYSQEQSDWGEFVFTKDEAGT